MNTQPQPVIGRSLSWGWWVIALLIASILFLIGYSIGFGMALSDGAEAQLMEFQQFRRMVLALVPFVVISLLFFLGLFSYSLYVDLFNGFPEFTHRPLSALFNVLVPVFNIYGIGLTYSRIINYLDQEVEDPGYEKLAHRLKVRLMLFYGGLSGVLVSLMFSLTLPGTAEALQMANVVIYSIAQIALIFWTLLGLLFLVLALMGVVRYRRRELEHSSYSSSGRGI